MLEDPPVGVQAQAAGDRTTPRQAGAAADGAMPGDPRARRQRTPRTMMPATATAIRCSGFSLKDPTPESTKAAIT